MTPPMNIRLGLQLLARHQAEHQPLLLGVHARVAVRALRRLRAVRGDAAAGGGGRGSRGTPARSSRSSPPRGARWRCGRCGTTARGGGRAPSRPAAAWPAAWPVARRAARQRHGRVSLHHAVVAARARHAAPAAASRATAARPGWSSDVCAGFAWQVAQPASRGPETSAKWHRAQVELSALRSVLPGSWVWQAAHGTERCSLIGCALCRKVTIAMCAVSGPPLGWQPRASTPRRARRPARGRRAAAMAADARHARRADAARAPRRRAQPASRQPAAAAARRDRRTPLAQRAPQDEADQHQARPQQHEPARRRPRRSSSAGAAARAASTTAWALGARSAHVARSFARPPAGAPPPCSGAWPGR